MNPLLIRRRGMMAKGTALPDGQLEWIETDGVAYIDTGYTPNVFSSCEVRMLFPADIPNNIIGVRNGTSNRFIYCGRVTGTGNISFQFASAIAQGWSFDETKVTTIQTRFVSTTSIYMYVTPDGESQVSHHFTTATGTPSLGGFALHIFGYNNSGTHAVCKPGTRFYHVKLYSDSNFGTLVKSYVPWRLNGEVGLMDTLTNTFYGNAAGSGAFIGGPNVI